MAARNRHNFWKRTWDKISSICAAITALSIVFFAGMWFGSFAKENEFNKKISDLESAQQKESTEQYKKGKAEGQRELIESVKFAREVLEYRDKIKQDAKK
jgi:hypothetical protein